MRRRVRETTGQRPAPWPKRCGRPAHGFTLVEVLVGSAVAIIGLYASMYLIMTSLRGNTERLDAGQAEHLAEHLLATIQTDAVRWSGDGLTGYYISAAPVPPVPGQGSPWTLAKQPGFDTDKRVGAMGGDTQLFDDGVLQEIPKDRGARYCAWWRLIWVTPELLRAEVRVAWARPQVAVEKYQQCPIGMADDLGNVGSITLPAMVMKNVYVQ